MSQFKRMWHSLTRPWLAAVLRDVWLCRITVGAVILLGLAHLGGYSLMPCPFLSLTGLPCPGCGMTRAFIAFFTGNWASVAVLHPYAPLFVVLGALMAFSAVATVRARQGIASMTERLERQTRLPAILLLSFALFGLLRVGFFFFMGAHASFPSAAF